MLCAPDEYVAPTVDVTPRAGREGHAILAHQGEIAREHPLPGIPVRLPEEARREIISTEQRARRPVPSRAVRVGSSPDGADPRVPPRSHLVRQGAAHPTRTRIRLLSGAPGLHWGDLPQGV